MTTRSRFIPVLVCTSLVALTAACASATTSSPAPSRSSPGPSATTGGQGDAAVWRLQPGQSLQATSTALTALVARLACNNGVTGEVLAPQVRRTDSAVIVTFEVVPRQPGAAQCNGNNEVPYKVDLGGPLEGRALMDGQCLPPSPAASTGVCDGGAARAPAPR
jgi:hypothetical protein